MLEFFRKYQRYFFLVVTVVIIISFSFFGTYSTLSEGNYHEQVAFTAIDGSEIKRSELDHLALFIGTDLEDKLLFGGQWGPNFLNDGVVKKDFFQTGLAALLAAQYSGEINQDLQSRLEKEKRYVPYIHPQAHFLSAEGAWSYFAPSISKNLELLRSSSSGTSSDALNAKIQLYLAEKKLPPSSLRQVLLYQQKQYSWLAPDPDLERIDLSLFGYHTLDDWFGPRFLRLISEFIINSSIIAEQRGYKVTQTEALADLRRNSENSFKQNLSNPHLGVANEAEYFNEQLNRMGLDQNKAAAIWRRVLLFRRFFHDMGDSVFVDPMTFQNLNQYTKETVQGDLYKLPKDLQFNSYRDLQLFEIYLNAISKRGEDEKALLAVPTKFNSIEEVAKKSPELVQKRYLLDIGQVNKKLLTAKVGVKETWNWEVEEQNWDQLKKQFPDLGIKKGDTREERFAALDSLDDRTRAAVDAYARKEIVEAHPEWIEKALQEGEPRRLTVGLKLQGGSTPFEGLEKREDFMKLLDKAKIGEQDPSLASFTADNNTYYRIVVIDRTPEKEVLTFAEAQKDGSLDKMLNKQLESYYEQVRDNHPQLFQNEDKSWKSFADVRGQVADLYFAGLLKAIRNDYAGAIAPEKAPQQMINEMSASLRLYAYVRDILSKIQKDPKAIEIYISQAPAVATEDKLAERKGLDNQWKLEKSLYRSDRGSEGKGENLSEAFTLTPGAWSKVQTSANGDLYFFQLAQKGSEANNVALVSKINVARKLLGDDAQKVLMKHLLNEMKTKGAISLDYMIKTPEMTPEMAPG